MPVYSSPSMPPVTTSVFPGMCPIISATGIRKVCVPVGTDTTEMGPG